MPEYKILPALLVLLAGIGTWAALYYLGGRSGRRYAIPTMSAVILFGIDWYYDLPWYAYMIAILIGPAVFHRSLRARLEAASKKMETIPMPDLGIRLRRIPDFSGKLVALWKAEPLAGDAGAIAEAAPIVAAPAGFENDSVASAPSSLAVALEFVGEDDDEYGIVFWGEAPKILPAEVVIHHKDADGRFTQILKAMDPVQNLPGQEPGLAIRSAPLDFAYSLLDVQSFALLHSLFELRSESREIYVHVEGRMIRIGSSRTFNGAELAQLVTAGARWIQKVRAASLALGRS